MTPDARLPLDFPPLLALAEANVRANWPIEEHTRARFGYGPRGDTLDDYCAEIRAFFIGCEADRLRDLTRRESQAGWLRWLALEPGVLLSVGCPAWQHDYRWSLNRDGTSYILHTAGSGVRFVFGASDKIQHECAANGGRIQGEVVVFCPALPDPDAPDAPIRALVVAVLTVGSRGAS